MNSTIFPDLQFVTLSEDDKIRRLYETTVVSGLVVTRRAPFVIH